MIIKGSSIVYNTKEARIWIGSGLDNNKISIDSVVGAVMIWAHMNNSEV